jgi:gliding motility-associated-like protein
MKRFTLLFLALLFSHFAWATHVVGGSLTYEHLGGATYRLTLKMYRDCRPGNSAFPNNVTILIRDLNGAQFTPNKDVTIPFTGATAVNPYIDTCAANPGLCLEEAIYTRVVNNMPPQPGGYHMYYQYCCRNSTLSNVVNPLGTGETWYAQVPDMSALITNSSPVWVNPPPVFVCQAEQINFDFSATDADGDSLAYSWYTPYTNTAPTFPGGIATFSPINWVGGYGPNNACGGPNLTVNPQNGFITGAPPNVGQFVAGIRCQEFRNGILIGEILRDFQFNVVYCPPLAQAIIGQPQGVCSGSTVNFQNLSGSSSSYFWDFGDGNTINDTSSLFSPSYTYPGLGPYNVMLIINVGTACADTGYQIVELSFVNVAYTGSNDSACVGQPITFTDGSTPSANSTITGYWWDFGDGNQDTAQNPTHAWSSSGVYTISHTATNQLGCDDTIYTTVTILPAPIALAGNDTFACSNNATIGLGGNVLNVTGGVWMGAGTFSPNNTTLNATYTPTVAEVNAGFTYISLQTTGPTLCAHDIDSIRIDFVPGPTSDVGADIYVCSDTPYVAICAAITLASGGVWSSSGTGTFTNANSLCTDYIPGAADILAGQVQLWLSTTGNGNCVSESDTLTLFLTPPPNVTAFGPDTACSNIPFNVTATTATGQGYWSTTGDGTFPNGNAGLSVDYLPGPTDFANGQVAIIFNSLNNGGCQQQYDTLFVTIVPAPNTQFAYTGVCPFVPMQFNDLSTAVSPIVSWNWNFGDPSSSSNTSSQQNPTHTYGAGGWYNVTLIVSSANGCPDTTVQSVYVYPQPVTNFITSGICLNDGTLFDDVSTVDSASIASWLWNFGDNTSSTDSLPTHVFGNAGTWNVTLIVTSNFGCSDTVTVPVVIVPSPTAAFTADPSATANTQQQVNFTDQSYTNILTWLWDFGDSTSQSTNQNPSHSWQNPGTYEVTLVVVDANGCTDTTVYDYIISSPPVVPSGFSPNGDGQNDFFIVRGGPFTELEFRIYNTWGELIYVGTTQFPGWDGTRDGIPQPVGVYAYTVRAVTPDGKQHTLSGDVTLVR